MMGRPKDDADEENSISFEGDGSKDGKFDDNEDEDTNICLELGEENCNGVHVREGKEDGDGDGDGDRDEKGW